MAAACWCGWAVIPTAAEDIRQLIVQEIRLSNPQTPLAYLEATRDLLNVGEAELAKSYVEQVLAMSLAAEERSQLYRQLGSAFFIRLQQAPGLGSAGKQLAERFVAAALRAATDPQRLEGLAEQARDADPAIRRAARGALREAGAAAVAPVMSALLAEQRASQQGWLREALAAIGPAAVTPLIGSLASGDPQRESWALTALADQPPQFSQPALPFLARAAFDDQAPANNRQLARQMLSRAAGIASRPGAVSLLRREIAQRLPATPRQAAADASPREIWLWDEATGQLEPRLMTEDTLAWLQASWLADDLMRLAPTELPHQLDLLITHLGWAKQLYGWEQPLPETFATTWLRQLPGYARLLGRVLEQAVQQGWDDTAQAAAELLRQVSADDFAASQRSNLAALGQALRAPSARVRWAAAETLLARAPAHAFASTSDLVDELCRVAGAQGVRRVLLAQPSSPQAANLANWLGAMGFAALQVADGQQLLRALRSDPDVELIFVSDALARPDWHELLQQLAANYHAARLPAAVLTQGAHFLRAEEQLARLGYGIAAVMPQHPEALGELVARSLANAGPVPDSPHLRLARAAQALQWIEYLAERRSELPHYDLARCEAPVMGGLQHPLLAPHAVATLATLATPQAQASLAEFAAQAWHPLELRLQAVEGLRSAIALSGLRLTQQQVLRQYDQYNRSLGDSPESSEVLSRLLDALESPPPSP